MQFIRQRIHFNIIIHQISSSVGTITRHSCAHRVRHLNNIHNQVISFLEKNWKRKSHWPDLPLDQHCCHSCCFYFAWNAFFLASYPRYNSVKPTEHSTTNPYPSFLNPIPSVNVPFVPPSVPATSSSTRSTQRKRSIPSNSRKRPRLTAQLRNEILQIRANRPTIFIWEIQQILIENGICTTQNLPHVNCSIFSYEFHPWTSFFSRRQLFNVFSTNPSIRSKKNRKPMRI